MAKRALITGITGQDAAYLADLLLKKDYEVYGAYRHTSSLNLWRLEELEIAEKISLVAMDLLEFTNIFRVLEKIRPNEIYNLAAQSFVAASFEQPIYVGEVDALGVARLLEAVRACCPEARFYQASTSEMFGKVREIPQSETTPFHPRSPYGVAKLYAHWFTINYRESYGLHASSGILFNHESPLRGMNFVSRKVTSAFARVFHGRQECVELGNLDASRDWGYAGDYVDGMWRMLQQPAGGDYVLATGETHTVRAFVERAAAHIGWSLRWEGEKENTVGIDQATGRILVRVNPDYYRPAEVDLLIGDCRKAQSALDWRPAMRFETLIEKMVDADVRRIGANMLLF